MYMPDGGRPLARYEDVLFFNRRDLHGKRVLDLGAGPEIKFARGLRAADIGAAVVSLSPDFSDRNIAATPNKLLPGGLVAAIGQELPFDNGTFDYVFALHVGEHLLKPDKQAVMLEMCRVLAPGGEAHFGPLVGLYDHDPYYWTRSSKELQQPLADMGITTECIPILPGVVTPARLQDDARLRWYVPAYTLIMTAPQQAAS